MASAPPATGMPPLYNQLVPLSSNTHAAMRMRPLAEAGFAATMHAVPLTAEEFGFAQRDYPIVFSVGEQAVPLALMGLNDGINTFIGADGRFEEGIYLPAYLRRYPFMLVKLRPEADELSLCFDPTSGAVQEAEGEPLFDGAEPSAQTRAILEFCEKFEQAAQMTAAFVKDLEDMKLLMDGEVSIKRDEDANAFTYRGFRMIDENALRELRGDQLRKLAQSGALPLIYAHMFSLGLMRDIFGRQVAQGRMPRAEPAPIPAPAPVYQPAF